MAAENAVRCAELGALDEELVVILSRLFPIHSVESFDEGVERDIQRQDLLSRSHRSNSGWSPHASIAPRRSWLAKMVFRTRSLITFAGMARHYVGNVSSGTTSHDGGILAKRRCL